MALSPFIDLASDRVGGAVILANDDSFASCENLVRAAEPIEKDEYVASGKWMDGWETRRRRRPGHDWCIVRLGLRGQVRQLVVDTRFFRGNYPERCSVEACDARGYPPADELAGSPGWFELLAASPLEGHNQNHFAVECDRPITHLRLNIFPDGGVARLRVLGEVAPDWDALDATGKLVDRAALASGGHVVDASDMFYGDPRNMLMPGDARDMSDGWETRRRRGPGHDWVVIRLGAPGRLARVEVDTRHFKHNAPGQVALEGTAGASLTAERLRDDALWRPLLPRTPVLPHTVHRFGADALAGGAGLVSHVRLHAYPDGGLARLRLLGRTERGERLLVGLGRKNTLAREAMAEELVRVCGSARWAAQVAAEAPFADLAQLAATADRVWRGLARDDILAAFAAHPRIGERTGGAWSKGEQAGASAAAAEVQAALGAGNRAYEERFGYIYLVCASGKSAEEMLADQQQRMANPPDRELQVAAEEQRKITRLRLVKWLNE